MYPRLCSFSSMVERSKQKQFSKEAEMSKTGPKHATETETNVNIWSGGSVHYWKRTKTLSFCQFNLHLQPHDMTVWSNIADYLNFQSSFWDLQLKRDTLFWPQFTCWIKIKFRFQTSPSDPDPPTLPSNEPASKASYFSINRLYPNPHQKRRRREKKTTTSSPS